MAKPKLLYRVEVSDRPRDWYVYNPKRPRWPRTPKRTFAQRRQAEKLAERVRAAGGTAKVFVTECDWKPL